MSLFFGRFLSAQVTSLKHTWAFKASFSSYEIQSIYYEGQRAKKFRFQKYLAMFSFFGTQ
jgi:hypothetical protein